MTRDDIIDLLRSLSIIEGASRVAQKEVSQVIDDELEWIVSLLLKELKEKND